jgi:predicted nuclease with TOPRIM domain
MINNEISFDTQSGISVEEQKEILTQINGITEKYRQQLAQKDNFKQEGNKSIIKAEKNGAVFPIAVNIAAVLMLVFGALLLITFNTRTYALARSGNAVYNLTERTLIEEIRRDTALAIAAKETEIALIASRLFEVDDELLQLYSSNLALTSEQRSSQERLLSMQNAFREELSILQDERSLILENSRSREARLRAQLDERTREFAHVQTRAGELDSAVSELERLTGEQEILTALDAQFSGALAAIRNFIQNNQYDEAMQTAANLRQLSGSNVLISSRTFQSRRIFYNQTLDFVEALITNARRGSGGGNAEQIDLLSRNVQLENNISELQKTIEALSSGGTGLTGRISELEETISSLRNANSLQEQNAAEKDGKIALLETENSGFTLTISQLRDANVSQEQEIANLRNQITIIRQALMEN